MEIWIPSRDTLANTLLQPGPTHVVPSLTARLRKSVRETLRAEIYIESSFREKL